MWAASMNPACSRTSIANFGYHISVSSTKEASFSSIEGARGRGAYTGVPECQAVVPTPQKNGPDVGATVTRHPRPSSRSSRRFGSWGTFTARYEVPSLRRRRMIEDESPWISSSGVR
jgi:hypothetical protein